MTAPIRQRRWSATAGFSLIELIVVIIILGVIGSNFANFIRFGSAIYIDAVGREQLINQSRFLIERMTRELRSALPNSVRVISGGNTHCIEFVPIKASSSHGDTSSAFGLPVNSPDDEIWVVQHGVPFVDADKMVVYPLNASEVYSINVLGGNTFSLNNVPTAGSIFMSFVQSDTLQFRAGSPSQRYYLVKNAISYCADVSSNSSTAGQIRRYAGYWPPVNQSNPLKNSDGLVLGNGVLMAEDLKSASVPFIYSGATLVSNALVKIELNFIRGDEEVAFYHEVHLVNVP